MGGVQKGLLPVLLGVPALYVGLSMLAWVTFACLHIRQHVTGIPECSTQQEHAVRPC